MLYYVIILECIETIILVIDWFYNNIFIISAHENGLVIVILILLLIINIIIYVVYIPSKSMPMSIGVLVLYNLWITLLVR